MKDKFGQFDWKCCKDDKPTHQSWIYIYYADIPDGDVEIIQENDCSFDDYTYWCYVFIPDPPKIEKNTTLEERISYLEKTLSGLCKRILESGIIK